jgi:transposase-like protein
MFTCKHCNTKKPTENFYVSSKSKCKECIKSNVRLYRKQNLERIQEHDRQRNSQPHRIQARKEYIKTDAGKQSKKKSDSAYKKRYPMVYASHVIANNAIREGKLVPAKKCSVCNSTNKIEGHHDNYTKPLVVRWLCEPCHKTWHQNNKPIYE